MVCKFVRYGHIKKEIALYMHWFNSDGSPKSEVSRLKNLRIFNFQALDLKFALAIEPRVVKQECSSAFLQRFSQNAISQNTCTSLLVTACNIPENSNVAL